MQKFSRAFQQITIDQYNRNYQGKGSWLWFPLAMQISTVFCQILKIHLLSAKGG